MPWAGKTTISKALSARLNYEFIDLDHEVEKATNMNLVDVMKEKGPGYFRTMGYNFLVKLKPESSVVISPAGSVIFHEPSMQWIQDNSFIIFLNTPFEIIEQRSKLEDKAVANLKERGLKSIWDERIPIYTKFAEAIINLENKNVGEIVDEIIAIINSK